MKKILVLVFSDLRNDARVRRQIEFLQNEFLVTVVCFDANPRTVFEVIRIDPTPLTITRKAISAFFLVARQYKYAWRILHGYAELANRLRTEKFDLIIANDVETLPLAFQIDPAAKVLFDAHEYAPRHFEDKRMWRLFFQGFNTWLCRKYIPKIVGMTTIGKGLADEYEKNFGIKPVVITNANNFFDSSPSPVPDDKIRLIHHGIATRSRKMELMIELMNLLDDRFTLDLMLLTPGFASAATRGYIDELKEKAKPNPRIRVIPPVKSAEVVKAIQPYDMGVFLLPPVNFNYANTLPNKLFDFIQARLGIAIGPTPEMAEIVKKYHNGVVSENFLPETLAKRMNALTQDDVAKFKFNSGLAAKVLNAEANEQTLLQLVKKLTR